MKTSVDNLKLTLAQQYELVCFEDLANYYSLHQPIFDLFKKYRRESFTDTQRLVLYSSNNPSQEFLNHIQRAASRVDISNFFILLVTPFDLSEKIQEANRCYGYDNTMINFSVQDMEPTAPYGAVGFIRNHSTMCAYPFMMLSVVQSRGVTPCCKFGEHVGNLEKNTLDEIFNNSRMASIRQSMLDGQRLPECHICWGLENNNLTSHRTHGMNKYSDYLDQHWFDDIKVRSLDVSPSTLCNFNCRICDPKSSSSIAVEEIQYATTNEQVTKLKQIIHLNKDDFSKSTPLRIVNSLKDVEFLHIMGGEPFKWPQLCELLELAIEQGYASNINLAFNTNGSIYPASLIDTLKKFKSVEILLSIDDIGQRFEIQRGSNWPEIYENIKMFRNLKSQTIDVKAAITINIQNLLYLDQVAEFFQRVGIDIVWWYLEDPEYLCIDRVTAVVKNLVSQKYQSHPIRELSNLVTRMKSTAPTDGTQFLEYMAKLDKRRGQDFKLAHIEIFNAMSNNESPNLLDSFSTNSVH